MSLHSKLSIDLLEQIDEPSLSVSWTKDEHDKLTLLIPSGYEYCQECKCFTPHITDTTTFQYTEQHICEVCDHTKDWDNTCEHCGNDMGEPEDHFAHENSYYKKKHHSGCHCIVEYGNDDDHYFDKMNGWCGSIYLINDTHVSKILSEFIEDLSNLDLLRFGSELKNANNIECGCPVIEVLPVNNIASYHTHNVYSPDCSNAMDWDYELRCPICGELKYYEDSNC